MYIHIGSFINKMRNISDLNAEENDVVVWDITSFQFFYEALKNTHTHSCYQNSFNNNNWHIFPCSLQLTTDSPNLMGFLLRD